MDYKFNRISVVSECQLRSSVYLIQLIMKVWHPRNDFLIHLHVCNQSWLLSHSMIDCLIANSPIQKSYSCDITNLFHEELVKLIKIKKICFPPKLVVNNNRK